LRTRIRLQGPARLLGLQPVDHWPQNPRRLDRANTEGLDNAYSGRIRHPGLL